MSITPQAEEKQRALRRMKFIATGAFVLMAVVFALTLSLGEQTIVWVIRWDHVNAFSEAAMVGALADWFAVVALFRHPLGIPIWHTAIIPNKKDQIGRNLGGFVEQRLLSIENLEREIGNFSPSKAVLNFLSDEPNRNRAAEWVTDGLGSLIRALDDEQVELIVRDLVQGRIERLDASRMMGRGLEMVASSGKHNELLDGVLKQVAVWVPSRRDTIHEFIERSMRKMLKWGSNLVPQAVVDRATEQVLTAIIEMLYEAAADANHPMRRDFDRQVHQWTERLKDDPEWRGRIEGWKRELIDHPDLRTQVEGLWGQAKAWLLADLEREDSTIRGYVLRAINSGYQHLERDPELRSTLDQKLRQAAITFLSSHHHTIGSLIQRVVDSWDAKQLSRELELNLGRDLQYIRLNGTFIGGLVGLLIHIIAK